MRIEGNCSKCGVWRFSLHQDHILAKRRGGSDDSSNIQLLCANCHQDKTRIDMTGRKCSPEAIAKMAAAKKGKPWTEKQRACHLPRVSKSKFPALTLEQRAKATAKRRGRTLSEETKAKIRAACRSEANRARLRKAWKARAAALREAIV